MAKFDIKTVKPKFVVTTAPETKIDVSINRPIITAKNQKAYFKLKNTGGPKGEKGDTGVAATITVGSTSTGAPGTSASVTNTGSASAAVLDFVIPKGDKGDTGDTGATGSPGEAATVAVGTTTTGDPGTNASVTNSGTQSAAVLNFTIPRGDKGDQGDPGTPGTAATIAVGTTQTGNPGTSASVVNSGTSSAAVLDFTIPRGAKGDQGNPGSAATVAVGTVTTGLPGTSATVTNVGTSSAAVFDFTIPRGDKGEAGSGSGDMLVADYDPNGTVASAGGIVDYVTAHEPTKTSDLVNDGADGMSTYVEANGLAAVATSGSYNDLSDKPTIPAAQVQSDWTQTTTTAVDYIKNKPALSAVATSGSYSDLSDKPTIPAAQVNSDWDANSGVAQILNKPTLSTVATSGSYNDLSNKPTIPTVNDATLTITQNGTSVGTFTANQSTNATANITVPTATSDLTNDGADGTSAYVEADELATVATTGDYSDLSGTPTIPTVNDALLTITQKGSTLGTFTANASSAETINIAAPYCDGLYGQAQTAAYRRSVIALCEVSTTAQSSKNSWFCGRIAFHRDNGLSGVEVVNINMENQYYKAYYTNVSYYSNFTVLSSTASKDTAIGWRPCTFKYNNVYYGGIEICTNIANHNVIWYETIGNFTPFGVDYYSMSHDSTASSVLNSEINNSISFTQWDETYNQWYMGQAKREVIYNNASGTNANFSTTSAMSNYDEVEISYRDGNNNYAYKTIPGAARNFVLDISHPGASGTVYWYISRFIVSGTSITVGANNVRKVISTTISSTTSQDIYITRIIGIKY